MIERGVAIRYVRALIELTEEKGVLEAAGEELKFVKDVVESNPSLRDILSHKLMPKEEKKELLRKVFQGSLSDLVMNYLFVLIDNKRESILEESYDRYLILLGEKRGIIKGKIKSAYPISEDRIKKLKAKLNYITNKEVDFDVEISPEILGGLVITLGSRIIDASIPNRLKDMKERLLNITI